MTDLPPRAPHDAHQAPHFAVQDGCARTTRIPRNTPLGPPASRGSPSPRSTAHGRRPRHAPDKPCQIPGEPGFVAGLGPCVRPRSPAQKAAPAPGSRAGAWRVDTRTGPPSVACRTSVRRGCATVLVLLKQTTCVTRPRRG